MPIDWFTVSAQALNFLILVWLMKRFLYQPILDAIDAREKRIATELADADAKKAQARQQRDEFEQKNLMFDQQRAALLSQAVTDAQSERQRLIDAAQTAVNTLRAQRMDLLRNEAQNLKQDIRRRTQQEVFAIARKVLADLASASLEERIAEVFIRHLRGQDTEGRARLAEAFKATSEPALLRSAFDLPETQRETIQQAINETFSATPSKTICLRFETSPELVSGIELSANGQKVAWSISDYLNALEKAVDELVKTDGQPKTQTGLEPAKAHEQGR